MDTSLSLTPFAVASQAKGPVLERSITTKVAKIEAGEQAATMPSDKPFVAQVVNARLSGSDFPDNPGEITPPERTLRPYDVPMLPFEAEAETMADAVTIRADADTPPATTQSGAEAV